MDLHCQYLIFVKYCSVIFTLCASAWFLLCISVWMQRLPQISEKNLNGLNTWTSIYSGWIYSFYHLGEDIILACWTLLRIKTLLVGDWLSPSCLDDDVINNDVYYDHSENRDHVHDKINWWKCKCFVKLTRVEFDILLVCWLEYSEILWFSKGCNVVLQLEPWEGLNWACGYIYLLMFLYLC
jgi:hypothetical protein